MSQYLQFAAVLLEECFIVHDTEGRLWIEAFLLRVLDLQVHAKTLPLFVVL